uniref:F-box/kelch-repeat protein At3g23880 family n=1 Tax=Cajanus cajan TaxID=3821 RepID=A0A151SKQ6_CAJCA|nr:F-box/kelch-repeat protein At3g23880 family [Cajanus cajan]
MNNVGYTAAPYNVYSMIHPQPLVTVGEAYDVVGVCNGLVCLSGINANISKPWVQFWNPATRLRSKKVPCTYEGTKLLRLGFGYDDSSDTYKVVAAAESWDSREFELGVHCLGHHGWRKIASWTDFSFSYTLQPEGQFLSDTFNWLAKHATMLIDVQFFRWI